MAARFIWPGLRRDVTQWVAECQRCQHTKSGRSFQHPPLPFMVHDRFNTVHIDIVGPLPVSSRGHQYLLTLVDHFTRWIEAVPIANISAECCAEKFMEHWVSRYGTPAIVVSDQGRQFESTLFTSLLRG